MGVRDAWGRGMVQVDAHGRYRQGFPQYLTAGHCTYTESTEN